MYRPKGRRYVHQDTTRWRRVWNAAQRSEGTESNYLAGEGIRSIMLQHGHLSLRLPML